MDTTRGGRGKPLPYNTIPRALVLGMTGRFAPQDDRGAGYFFAAAALVDLPSMLTVHFWPSSDVSYLKV